MTVSLLITTYNWKEALTLTLRSVFCQTILPNEIIIADDGSRDDTFEVIKLLRLETSIPILHVWHEDNGFRLTTIRNKAIAAASSQYIIQIDGDIILNKYFIQDHIELAEANCFVCGSRVKINANDSKSIFDGNNYNFGFFNQSHRSMFNSLRSKFLRGFLAHRYKNNSIAKLRGCNMAFWKKDLIEVNGYNEDLKEWGHEDSEIAYRLHFAGKKKKYLKMGGVAYHLDHTKASRDNEDFHRQTINRLIREKSIWCDNGLNKYLNGEK